MFKPALWVTVACLMLAGCVLQSEKPIYAEADGKLVLKAYGNHFTAESFNGGAWKTEEGEIQFSASGRHYLVRNSKDDKTAEALFAEVGGDLAMLQFGDAEMPSTYIIAELQKDAVLLRPIMCSDLKKALIKSALLSFSQNDCKLSGKPTAADLKAWVAALGPAGMRLVPKK